MKYYLGLLGAARISRAVLAKETGEIIVSIIAPPLTLWVNKTLSFHLRETFERLANEARLTYSDMVKNLKGACISMSGLRYDCDLASVRQILHKIQFEGDSEPLICRDTCAHFAASFIKYGGLVIASTGSIVILQGHDLTKPITVNGWGSVLGDEGGGYDLGTHCLQYIFKAHDGKNKKSQALEQKILEHLGLTKIDEIIPWYYRIRESFVWRSEIADLSTPLIELAEKGNDPIAQEIVKERAHLLLGSFKFAISKAQLQKDEYRETMPLILEGGLFENSKIYVETFRSWLEENKMSELSFKIKPPKYHPVIGSLALAMTGAPYYQMSHLDIEKICSSARKEGLVVLNFGGERHNES